MKNYKVKIKNILWLNKTNPEAEVVFEINRNQYTAFCHPCYFNNAETVDVYFDFLEEEISEKKFWTENKNHKKEIIATEIISWRYYCYGKIETISPVTVDCGDLIFELGDWISDKSSIGSYVYFVIARLDIFQTKK